MATNLIKEKVNLPLKRGFFQRIFGNIQYLEVPKNAAIILSKAGSSGYVKYTSPVGVWWKDYNAYYVVDTSAKSIKISFDSPSKNVIYDFNINIELKSQVKNPIAVVQNNITNLEYHYEKEFVKKLQCVTVKHNHCDLSEVRGDLELEIDKVCKSINSKGDFNVEVSTLYVTIDQEYLRHMRDLQQLKREYKLERTKYFYRRSIHYTLKERLAKDLTEKANRLLIDDYLNNTDSGRKLVSEAGDMKLEGYNKKLSLFKKAKEEGVIVGKISEYMEEYYKPVESNKNQNVVQNKERDKKHKMPLPDDIFEAESTNTADNLVTTDTKK